MGCLIIRGGKIVYSWGIIEGDIIVVDGVVCGVGKNLPYSASGCEVIDARGKLVLPGAIDIHVHMREPGLEYKDDFTRGTLDALAGGVTTVLEMPNTLPPVDTRDRLIEKARLLEPKAYVDFGLYGVLHDDNIGELRGMVEAGAVGFKVFLGPTTGNIPAPSLPTLYEAMAFSSETGALLAFHAEEWSLVKYFTEKVRSTGRMDPEAHMDARPPICEEIAIRELATLAKHTGAHIHIVHMSSCEAVDALRDARTWGADVTGETNPHYLLLDSRDYSRYGTLIKVNPPIRGPRHRECLWEAVRDGTISIIASDHAPHSAEEKSRDIWEAPGGFPGVATLLPLMLDQALNGVVSLERVVELLSLNPAKRLGLYPRKGCLEPGCDGDIVVVDPNKTWVINRNSLHTKHKLTPFHGWRVRGSIEYVVLRGNVVYRAGEGALDRIGMFIKPVAPARRI